MFWDGKLRVLENETDEVTLEFRLDRRLAHDLAPEIREAAVRNNGEVCEEGLLFDRALFLACCTYAEDAAGQGTLNELRDGSLDDLDALGLLRLRAQRLNEATVVERAALIAIGVGNVYGAAPKHDAVAVRRDRVNALHTRLEPKLLQGHDASGLEELTDNPVRLGERAFEETYPERATAFDGGSGKRVGESRASDAGADDDYVVGFGPHGVARAWKRASHLGSRQGRLLNVVRGAPALSSLVSSSVST